MDKYLESGKALKDIADAFESSTKVLVNHSKRLDVLEREIDDLFDIVSRTGKAMKGKKYSKPIVLAAFGVGIYVGYRSAVKELDARQLRMRDLANKQAANTPKTDAPGKDDQQS